MTISGLIDPLSILFCFLFLFPPTFIFGMLLYAFNLLAFVNAIKILANLQEKLRNCCEQEGRRKKGNSHSVNLIARKLKSTKLFLEK